MKNKTKLWVLISLLICLISSVGASVFQTNFGKVTYHDMTFVTESGHEMDALLLIPDTATKENPAPAIVVSHGWYNNREMQDLNYVEYARRGYVVLAISMYGHGDSEVIPGSDHWVDENNANGLYDGVKYVATLPFADADNIGVTGHSNGALACREAVLQDEEGLIASALLVSNDAVYYDENGKVYNMFGARDAAIVACQYDEFFHRVTREDGSHTAPKDFIHQETAQSFLYFGENPANLPERESYTYYTADIDGQEAIRAVFNPAIIHPWAHFSKHVVEHSLEFFEKSLGAPVSLPYTNQIWQWKAAFNAVGVVGFFLFVIYAALALLDTGYFSELKTEKEILPLPAPEGKEKSRYFRGQIGAALFSIPAYFIAFILGYVVIRPAFLNQEGSRVIGFWCLLCGIFSILSMRRAYKRSKKAGMPMDLAAVGVKMDKKKLWKSIVLAVTVVAAAFSLVFLSDYLFLTDYRLWCFATIRAFEAEQLVLLLKFMPFWLVYYVAMSVSGNCFNYVSIGKKNWAPLVWQMFFVFLGSGLMIAIQYIKFFTTGYMVLDNITGIMGIWLFPIAIILPLASFICHKIYKKTGNPYIGGIIMGLIACLLAVTNTLTAV